MSRTRTFIFAGIATAALALGGGGVALAGGSGGGVMPTTVTFVPDFANQYAAQADLVAATCLHRDTTTARRIFAAREAGLDAMLVAGHYLINAGDGTAYQVISPDYDGYANTLTKCPKG